MDCFFVLNIHHRRIFTTNFIFRFAVMLKRLTIKDVPIISYELLNIKACSFHVLERGLRTQSLVVSCKYWVAPLISTRGLLSGHPIEDRAILRESLYVLWPSLPKTSFPFFFVTPAQSDELYHSRSSLFQFETIPRLYPLPSIVLWYHL